MNLEPRLPQRSSLFGDWCHRIHQWIRSLRIIDSPTVRATRTTEGTILMAIGGGLGGIASSQFKGQWVDGSYNQNDIVIRKRLAQELDDGNKAGTYIAGSAITPGSLPPGESEGTGAAFTVHVAAGAVTSIDVDDGGSGYPENARIVISGDGSDAAAHLTIDSDGVITGVVIDEGGSGYTAATASIATATQGWVDFALGRWQKLTLRVNNQRIVIDAGRDDGDAASLTIFGNKNDETAGSVQINIQDIIDSGAGNKVVKIREWEVCVDGVIQRALFLSSDHYDPPA